MIRVRVHGVALVPPDNAPVMLLQETVGEERWLPISIGTGEANALIAAQELVEHPRPDTVELMGHVVRAFGRRVERVEVTALDGGVFFADLVFDDDVRVSARPSDAIAIGLRAEAPLEVDEAVLDEASVDIELASETGGIDVEREVTDFRARLDEITAEDFGDTPPE